MTGFQASAVSPVNHVLAEGPLWVARTSSVLWVDVEEGVIFQGRFEGSAENKFASLSIDSQINFDGRVGAAVVGKDGGLLVAGHDRLIQVSTEGERLDGPQLIPAGVNSRANDGACDPAGRFLVGTLALDDRQGEEFLYRLEYDGTLTTLDSDLTLSNGLAWSPDTTLMYSTDTVPGIIWVRDYDTATGRTGPRTKFLQITDGHPDGICVDARGHLWVAIWGAGQVRSFGPDGRPGAIVNVPAPHVSSVAFVGDNLERLLITTASRDLNQDQKLAYPDAGRLFVADVQTAGLPTTPWASIV